MTSCPHCRAAAVSHPSRAWSIAHGMAWVYVFGSVLGASLVGPFIVGLAVPLLLGGTCLIAETHRRASAPGECGACGKYVWRRELRSAFATTRVPSTRPSSAAC